MSYISSNLKTNEKLVFKSSQSIKSLFFWSFIFGFIGLLLVLLPSIVVGVSGHQNEIVRVGPGLSYIPVYLQYYGLCILFLILVCKNLSNNKLKILLMVSLSLAVPISFLISAHQSITKSLHKSLKPVKQMWMLL